MKRIISEQGNGFPAVGDYVSDGDYLYRVGSIDSRIQTEQGRNNYVYSTVERVAWDACEADVQHTATVSCT